MSKANGNLLEVRDLRTYFDTEDGEVKAVDGVTFQLKRGETLGIVGLGRIGRAVAWRTSAPACEERWRERQPFARA